MVDSGATHSVLKTGTLNPTPPLSGKTVISVSAGGHHDKEKFTVPLTCSVQDVTVVKCQAHTKDTSSVARGNALADQAAKQAALSASPHILTSSPLTEEDHSPPCSLQDIQSFSTPEERSVWKANSCTPDSAGYNTARPLACPPAGHTPPNQPFDHLMMDFIELTPAEVLSQVQSVVKEALPRPASDLLHSLVPGDWILVRETRRKHWRSKR
ncbi:uncharacterized protein LOC121649364 isoform X3 [Melanotaenia boesemani]|uniref:uncharacterized protein LOC121649364 isoform X3 n=1 Tax=Melanotaenia boesemani TaxID=1250792 RepID=UPI001C050CF9|nr:uncharacterized protein LOC121649364 isoform X3 [Melanotaenia boesemani]